MGLTRFGGVMPPIRIKSIKVMLSCIISGPFVDVRIAMTCMVIDSHPTSASVEVWNGSCAVV
jgi:hypothetical protein